MSCGLSNTLSSHCFMVCYSKMLTVTPAPWHCSHWYRLPDFVPAPAHVLHLMFRDSDNFLQASCNRVLIGRSTAQTACGVQICQMHNAWAMAAPYNTH